MSPGSAIADVLSSAPVQIGLVLSAVAVLVALLVLFRHVLLAAGVSALRRAGPGIALTVGAYAWRRYRGDR